MPAKNRDNFVLNGKRKPSGFLFEYGERSPGTVYFSHASTCAAIPLPSRPYAARTSSVFPELPNFPELPANGYSPLEAQLPAGTSESSTRALFSKRVYFGKNKRSWVPVPPLRFLAMMTSAGSPAVSSSFCAICWKPATSASGTAGTPPPGRASWRCPLPSPPPTARCRSS